MKKISLKAILAISGLSLLSVGVAVDGNIFNLSNLGLRLSRASGEPYTTTLNSSNSPTLSGGAATTVDTKGVTWEYSGCATYASGHVTINANGYFGVSSATTYGYKGIESITANFSAGTNGELWLFTSINGTDWVEREMLTSEVATTLASGWHYIRLKNYDPDNNPININSVVISYSCTGDSEIEDSDSAKAENVISKSSNLTVSDEFSELSPRIPGATTKAVRLTKSGNASSNFVISFGRTYLMKEIIDKKIEFDLKGRGTGFVRTLNLMNGETVVGGVLNSDKSSYKWTNFQDDWWHVEAPISFFYSLISGYDKQDIPAAGVGDIQVNGIKLNSGSCVIDNFRISAEPCDLGAHNATYTCVKNKVYWFKIDWAGKLHSCTMTFSGDGQAEQVSLDDPKLKNGSPFYIRGLEVGEVTVTATVCSGYNRVIKTIQTTITVTAS